jgi:hypothetical protein
MTRNKPEKKIFFEFFVTTTFKSIVSALEGYFFYRALVTVFDTERQESLNSKHWNKKTC